jgi:hypothetical protein
MRMIPQVRNSSQEWSGSPVSAGGGPAHAPLRSTPGGRYMLPTMLKNAPW